jgi:hypothetical protein
MVDSNKTFDIVIAMKIVTAYNGDEKEDICTWIRELLLVAEVNGWTDKDIMRVAFLSLQEKARAWSAQILKGKMTEMTLEILLDLLKKRFSSATAGDISITSFCTLGVAMSREEFSNMLRQATTICERKVITPNALAEMVAHKAPAEIRALLFQTSKSVTTWEQFVQVAEELAPIAYRDKILARVESHVKKDFRKAEQTRGGSRDQHFRQQYFSQERRNVNGAPPRNQGQGKFYCQLHGFGSHKTSQCDQVTEMVKKEKARLGIRTVESDAVEEKEDNASMEVQNKNVIYYFTRLGATKNPFFIKGEIGGRTRTILLDTGADVSLVDVKDLRGQTGILSPYDGEVKSVSGESLKIKGKTSSLEIRIGKNVIKFSPLVMEECEYVILGADVIFKSPEILLKILKRPTPLSHAEESIRVVTENGLNEEFRDMFKTEIGELNLGTSGTHNIETGEARPICQRNGRIPIAQESDVESEI